MQDLTSVGPFRALNLQQSPRSMEENLIELGAARPTWLTPMGSSATGATSLISLPANPPDAMFTVIGPSKKEYKEYLVDLGFHGKHLSIIDFPSGTVGSLWHTKYLLWQEMVHGENGIYRRLQELRKLENRLAALSDADGQKYFLLLGVMRLRDELDTLIDEANALALWLKTVRPDATATEPSKPG